MNKLIITISKGKQTYGAWIDGLPGVYGQGDTVDEAKKELISGLELYLKYNEEIPDALNGEYEFEYKFDVPTFMEYSSDIFSEPVMERFT